MKIILTMVLLLCSVISRADVQSEIEERKKESQARDAEIALRMEESQARDAEIALRMEEKRKLAEAEQKKLKDAQQPPKVDAQLKVVAQPKVETNRVPESPSIFEPITGESAQKPPGNPMGILTSNKLPKGCDYFNAITKIGGYSDILITGKNNLLITLSGIKAVSCKDNSIAVIATQFKRGQDVQVDVPKSRLPKGLDEIDTEFYTENGSVYLLVLEDKKLILVRKEKAGTFKSVLIKVNNSGRSLFVGLNDNSTLEIDLKSFEEAIKENPPVPLEEKR